MKEEKGAVYILELYHRVRVECRGFIDSGSVAVIASGRDNWNFFRIGGGHDSTDRTHDIHCRFEAHARGILFSRMKQDLRRFVQT